MALNEEKELAEDFLNVIKVIEKYHYYILRRTIGLLYLAIAATVSIFVIFILFMVNVIPESLLPLVIVGIVAIMFIEIFVVSMNIFKLPKIYAKKERKKGRSNLIGKIWFIIFLITIPMMIIAPYLKFPDYTAPLVTQIFVGLGNMGNYIGSRKDEAYPGKIEKEYLLYSIIVLIAAVFIPYQPRYGWFIVTITALFGAYILGLYITLTADKALG